MYRYDDCSVEEEDAVGGFMRTKVYGTIGPACQDVDTLVHLFEEGMTGVRLNLSHTSLREASEWIANIRKAYRLYAKNAHLTEGMSAAVIPEILMDLQGPELRIGKLMAERCLEEGNGITLVPEGQNNLFDPTEIPVPTMVMPYLQPGQEVLLDDGKILLRVEELLRMQTGYVAEATVLRGGKLAGRKSIALHETKLYPPTLTESDLSNIKDANEFGITGVMLPFVRSEDDLKNLHQALVDADAKDIRIFAKIENMDGVNRLPELLPFCDEVVVARGDLGNAMPLWELPAVQARIANLCREAGKPFMIVTQMLASMEKKAVPTRAEVSDIFRAVNEGASSVMLTGETAAGEYPVEAMRYMVKTVRASEEYNHIH